MKDNWTIGMVFLYLENKIWLHKFHQGGKHIHWWDCNMRPRNISRDIFRHMTV